MPKRPSRFYVYIVECADGTFYTGCTSDLERRLKKHNSGKGAKYLRGRCPVRLIYAKRCASFGSALKTEIRIKALSHEEKRKVVSTRVL